MYVKSQNLVYGSTARNSKAIYSLKSLECQFSSLNTIFGAQNFKYPDLTNFFGSFVESVLSTESIKMSDKNNFELYDYKLIVSNPLKETISADKLGKFLVEFQKVFNCSNAFLDFEFSEINQNALISESELKEIEKKFRKFIRAFGKDHSPFYGFSTQDFPLEFSKIEMNSPLKLMGRCSAGAIVALALTVALAGGQAKIAGCEFQVNSLLDAINRFQHPGK